MNKHCDLCLYSYQTKDRESRLPGRKLRQHCCNPHYNARPYTFPRFIRDGTPTTAGSGRRVTKGEKLHER